MAKKKSLGKTKPNIQSAPPTQKASLLELAAPVSALVQIQGVALIESIVKRNKHSLNMPGEFRANINIPNVEFKADESGAGLVVMPTFTLKVEHISNSEGSLLLSIEASFELRYEMKSVENLEESNFRAFALTNGIYNAWPYWREYVQNTVARMDLPAVVIPVFRLD